MGITSSADIEAVAPSYWQHEYSPRATILDSQDYFDAWAARAALTRQQIQGRLDVAYGSGARERLDVFRGQASSGTLIFIHGGYWRAFGKEDFSWVADTFVKAGLTVVVLSYPLIPTAHMADISRSISRAINFLARELLSAQELTTLVVAGHSAGAQLAAHYLASSSKEAAQRKLDAIVCISGVFDLFPVSHAGVFAGMDMPPNELHAACPLYLPPPDRGSVLLALGADETREFHRQSERFADAWSKRVTGLIRIPGRHHFSVIDDLYDAGSDLSQLVLGLFKPYAKR
jgi:arylformamidase